MEETKFKKVKSFNDIKDDPRIERLVKNYDGYGFHMVEAIDGYRFESCNSTIEIGSIKQLCDEINKRMYKI